jgi:hypothetical protein
MTHTPPLSVQQIRDIRAHDRRMNWGRDFEDCSEHADDALIENLIEASHKRIYEEPSFGF